MKFSDAADHRVDLILINPGGREKIYQGLGKELTAIEQPLWIRLIAGYIQDKGWTVQIIDAEAENLSPEEVSDSVKVIRPRLVGMIVYGHQPSASTQQMSSASEICKLINIPIVIAGGHVSALPRRTFREEAVDYVAVGEGMVTIDGLLNGNPLGEIPGLVWKNVMETIINPPPPLIDVNELHGNVWELLPMDLYRAHNWQTDDRQPYASIYTSLGCPYACQFCCINAPFGGSGYRTRDPDSVIEEVRYLHDVYGIKIFKIIDEMFVLKPSHYIAICEGLAKLPFKLNIWAYARIDTVKSETLSLLRKAGIQWLALGIESGSSHVRDGVEKPIKEEDIYNIVQEIQNAGIKVIGNFMFGLPDDTMESMQETFDLALSLNLDFVNFYSAMAYPGSQLYNMAKEEDLPDSWSGYSQHSYNCKPLPTKTLTSAEVLRFRDNAHSLYFAGNRELTKPLKRCATN